MIALIKETNNGKRSYFFDKNKGGLSDKTSIYTLTGSDQVTMKDLKAYGFKPLTMTPVLIEHWEETFETTW